MNWHCPRCETFNRTGVTHCEVCDLVKPKRRTATKKTNSSRAAPMDLIRNNLPVKSASGEETLGFKVIDRRSSSVIKPSEIKPVVTKTSDPPLPSPDGKHFAKGTTEVQPSATPGGAITDAILWLVMIGFNIYFLYDFIVNQKLGIGSLILGMIFGNLILLVVIGVVLEFLKWLISPPNSTK